jgi:hypothetical protein
MNGGYSCTEPKLAIQDSKCLLSFPDGTRMTISGHREALAQAAQESDHLALSSVEEAAAGEDMEVDKGPYLIQGGGNCQVQ